MKFEGSLRKGTLLVLGSCRSGVRPKARINMGLTEERRGSGCLRRGAGGQQPRVPVGVSSGIAPESARWPSAFPTQPDQILLPLFLLISTADSAVSFLVVLVAQPFCKKGEFFYDDGKTLVVAEDLGGHSSNPSNEVVS